MMVAPLWGDTGGHTGTAPTNLHQTTRCAITASHCTFDSSKPCGVALPHRGYTFDSARQPHGVFIPHRIAHSIAPNHAVCHYPIGVILSIAQGWQVQRSLPWVTMQARGRPLGGCTLSTTLLFYVLPHTLGGGNASRTPAPIT